MSSAEQSPPTGTRQAEFGWPGGDRPGELRFEVGVTEEVRAALAGVVEGTIGKCGEIRALTAPDGAIGRYAVSGVDGREWFVRVSARGGAPGMEQEMTRYLHERGLAVNYLVAAGMRMEWGGETLRVDVRPRVRGRHFDGSITDLQGLAGALAECHRLLRAYPGAGPVRELAGARFAKLAELRERMRAELAARNFAFFCHDESWARAHAEWLGQLAREFEPRCDLLPGSQCLHGQIHQANVLYAPEPVLVDWEEAVQTYAPVQWDLAYFVQRFCLHDAAGHPEVRVRLGAVRAAYGAALGDLCGMMRHVAWLSAATLVGYHQRGIESPLAEYEKFVRLEEQARGLGGLLEEFAA
jgi:hypothetical protein